MSKISDTDINAVGRILNDKTKPLKDRFRALFTLKNLGGNVAIEQIQNCFNDTSALLKHELAYCLGQMQDPSAIPVLVNVLRDDTQEAMVRHEAAEALGAIGVDSVIPILEEYSRDPVIEVAETCQLALNRLQWLTVSDANLICTSKNPYGTVDPAPPTEIQDISVLKENLLNEKLPLFDRYRAMFALRNLRNKESVLALSEGLRAGSALFKHEVAFVLGQLQHESSVPYLRDSLEDPTENEMVRHECAEALGAIATAECFEILRKYLSDTKRVVRESCIVALDICEHQNSLQLQYADSLTKSCA
ncbi:deoxyhypusine hydroxylase [Orussus abietinus]|uniref:deoxyhypusine hydroxylase n=1 Tax=Orussus abietinus TaxID=222816 RepID=UPI000625CB77|nr:deoxyhypusine hydroxylase [Orussus abietinus]